MEAGEGVSLERIRALVEGSAGIEFAAPDRKDVYAWTRQVLVGQGYHGLKRADKGVIRAFIGRMTGRSRAQVARMIGQYAATGEVKSRRGKGRRFKQRYTRQDIAVLAEVDEAHDGLSGPATQKILYRAFFEFADERFERLAGISSAHIYNLRQREAYRERRLDWKKTRPSGVAIGERRKPEPRGLPGYLRIDTVHQGDLDGEKGVYHINAVDEVTQWQVVVAVPRISEAWLIPALEAMLRQFPFQIRGFHSDNGSEFINRMVEKLLRKLLIEQTKSRAGHCHDNALAETKNGAVVRKHMGYEHIAAGEAERVNEFH
jgi:transposase InsO family protein